METIAEKPKRVRKPRVKKVVDPLAPPKIRILDLSKPKRVRKSRVRKESVEPDYKKALDYEHLESIFNMDGPICGSC
jgi:hypothetical protein